MIYKFFFIFYFYFYVVSVEPEVMTAPPSIFTTPNLSTPSTISTVTVLSTPTPPSQLLAPVVVDIGFIAGVVTAGVLLVLVIVIVITCCVVWCRRDKTDRLNSVSDLVSHFNSNRAISQTAVALEEIADSHERANEDLLNIPDQDYEVITSDNDAYQAAIKPGRDNVHLVSNEAYATSTNLRSEVSHFNSNRAISQTAVALEEIADSHERANEDLLNIPDQDYEVITSDNDAYQAAIKPGRDNVHLVSNEAYATSTNLRSEVSHFNSNRAISQTAVALEEIADSHERANEDLLNIPDQDYEVITSDNDAYQAAIKPGRDNVHLVSNEAYATSTNLRSEDHEYSYVDENCVTGIGTQGEENKVFTSHSITDQAATEHAKLTPDKEDQENTYVNDSCPGFPGLENEVTTFVNVAYEGVNKHNQEDLCLNSNAA